MAEKKITRKVITTRPSDEGKKLPPKVEVVKKEEIISEVEETSTLREARPKRGCSFCIAKTTPSYTDLNALRRYLTERAKILPRGRSGVCSKHQRLVAKNIKYARHLSLLPFVPSI